MSTSWVKVICASVFEVFWVVGLKHASSGWEWLGTIISIGISFYAMISATRKLPVGTVYSVLVGLGAAGAILVETVIYGEPFSLVKTILVLILLAGVIGLKQATIEESVRGEA